MTAENSHALGRTTTYVDVPLEQWQDQELSRRDLPDHVFDHLLTVARLHAANRYDRLTHDVEAITGRPSTSTRDFAACHAEFIQAKRNARSRRVVSHAYRQSEEAKLLEKTICPHFGNRWLEKRK
jgi:hypothetical protein